MDSLILGKFQIKKLSISFDLSNGKCKLEFRFWLSRKVDSNQNRPISYRMNIPEQVFTSNW